MGSFEFKNLGGVGFYFRTRRYREINFSLSQCRESLESAFKIFVIYIESKVRSKRSGVESCNEYIARCRVAKVS